MATPTRTIPQRELHNSISSVLRDVEAGATVRVTVAGRPVADLVPVTGRQMFVPSEVFERIRREAPLDARFERDVAGIMGDRLEDE